MKASFLIEPGVIEMRDIDAPTPDHDQVLVKVAAVGVCGSDVHFYAHGNIGTMIMNQPFVLGHELSGTITAVEKMLTHPESVSASPLNPSARAEHAPSAVLADTTSALKLSFMQSPT